MLLNELAQYLGSVEAAVRGIQNANVERYEEEILSFPYHKHTPIGVESAQKPSIIEVINEATDF
ncbi:MAG: hypothetical protein ACREOI_23495 [bacterium]